MVVEEYSMEEEVLGYEKYPEDRQMHPEGTGRHLSHMEKCSTEESVNR